MLPLHTSAPEFSLINTVDGATITLNSFARNKPVMIAFICNHCPYVVHLIDPFTQLANEYQEKGIATVAISANDIATHPDDAPDKMQQLAREKGFSFPYCYDETQAVAQSYQAACTPDFYLFNDQHQLVYRGRFDASKPNSGIAATGDDLRQALDALLNNQPIDANQIASMGCNIKWKQT